MNQKNQVPRKNIQKWIFCILKTDLVKNFTTMMSGINVLFNYYFKYL